MSSDDYESDNFILQTFEGWFDPCPISKGELREFDGLGSDWKDKTFVNPPYSDIDRWVDKAIEENMKGRLIVMLLNVDTSTNWYMKLYLYGAKFLMIHGRLKHKTGNPAKFASMLVILER